MLNMFVRQINEVETNVVSVERIDEYSKTKSEVGTYVCFFLFCVRGENQNAS